MTVTTQQSRVRYTGSAAAPDRFPIPFPFFDSADIAVVRQAADGSETALTEGTDYTVDSTGPDRDVVLGSPLLASEVLAIYRDMAFVQETDLVENEAFFAEVVEAQFDRDVLYIQQLAERLERSLVLPVTSDKTDVVLPPPESGRILVGRADEQGWDNKTIGDLSGDSVTLPLPITDGGSGGATAEAARANLGIPMSDTETKTASFAVAATDAGKTYLCNSASGDIGVTLPAAADAGDGFVVTIKKTVAANTVTIDPDGSETIDGDGTSALTAVNAAVMIQCDGSAWYRTSVNADAALPRGYLSGLGLANGAADADHDIDIAAGECRDDADAQDLSLPAPLTKRLDAAWAVGTGNGGLDTGAAANETWYHVFLISNGSVVDALFSTSADSPTMPGGYSYKRRIGAVRTDGSANVLGFTQNGNEFIWDTPPLDESLASGSTTSAVLVTLSVPTGLRVKAFCHVRAGDNAGYYSSPDSADLAPGSTIAPLSVMESFGGTATGVGAAVAVWTDTSARIRRRLQGNSASYIATLGWLDPTLGAYGAGGGAAGSGGGAPAGDPYLTVGDASSALTGERRIAVVDGLAATDNGAGATYEIGIDLAADSGLEVAGGALRVKAADAIRRTAAGLTVDVEGLAAAGALDGSNDLVLVWDESAGAPVKATLAALDVSGSGGAPTDAPYLTLSPDGVLSNERSLSAGNGLSGTDSGAGGAYTLAVDLLSEGGLAFQAGKLAAAVQTGLQRTASGIGLAIDALTALAAPDSAADSVLVWDASAAQHRKLLLSHLPSSGAPTDAPYLTLGNHGSLTGDRALVASHGLTGTDGGGNGNYTLSVNLRADAGLAFTAGALGIDTAAGLTTGSGGLALDIGALPAEATLDGGADYLAMYDGSAGSHKKVLLQNLPGLDAAIVTLGTTAGLANERVLTAGDGLDLADGGAGSTATLSLDLASGGGLEIVGGAVALKIDSGASLSAAGLAIDSASDSRAGLVEFATDAEAQAGTATDRALTPANLAAAALLQGTHSLFVPAAAMRPTLSNGCAELTEVATTTGRPDLQVLDFDATADEHAQFQIAFPRSWNAGTVAFRPYWTTSDTGSDGVAWAMQGVACADGAAAGTAYGNPVVVTDDSQSTALAVLVAPWSAALTIAGSPGPDQLCFFRLFRDVSDPNDTLTADARLIGIDIRFTISAGDDG